MLIRLGIRLGTSQSCTPGKSEMKQQPLKMKQARNLRERSFVRYRRNRGENRMFCRKVQLPEEDAYRRGHTRIVAGETQRGSRSSSHPSEAEPTPLKSSACACGGKHAVWRDAAPTDWVETTASDRPCAWYVQFSFVLPETRTYQFSEYPKRKEQQQDAMVLS